MARHPTSALALAYKWLLACALSALAPAPGASAALGEFVADPPWPLCGRISESPPVGWALGDDCPAVRHGNVLFDDAPISSSFGPRQLVSEGFRYDFHRGIDIPTPAGTPLFAVAAGEVIKAGVDAAFTDPVIAIRHFRPGASSCSVEGGCYTSMYLHVSTVAVALGSTLTKGQYIGNSGTSSASGFEHLHLEIRDAPPSDPHSAWQKDCVHPLALLPYDDSGASNINLVINSVNTASPLAPIVTASVTIPMGVELDFERIEAEVFARGPGGQLSPVAQPGNTALGNTVEGGGYAVDPPWFSVNERKRGGFTTNVKWQLKNAAATDINDFLAPDLDADVTYSLCVFDSSAGQQPVLAADFSGMARCGSKPCWKKLGGRGFKFSNRRGIPLGINSGKFIAGVDGKTQARIVGKGPKLVDVTLPLVFPLTAQLIATNATQTRCWQTDFAASQKNSSGAMKAKSP